MRFPGFINWIFKSDVYAIQLFHNLNCLRWNRCSCDCSELLRWDEHNHYSCHQQDLDALVYILASQSDKKYPVTSPVRASWIGRRRDRSWSHSKSIHPYHDGIRTVLIRLTSGIRALIRPNPVFWKSGLLTAPFQHEGCWQVAEGIALPEWRLPVRFSAVWRIL